MYACPICQTRSIGFLRKWLSDDAYPAYCSACKGYSSAHESSGGVGLVLFALLMTACGFAASALASAWPLLLGVPGGIGIYLWKWHQAALTPLTPRLVAVARKTEAMSFAALLLAALFG
jgi:hypothetical protein